MQVIWCFARLSGAFSSNALIYNGGQVQGVGESSASIFRGTNPDLETLSGSKKRFPGVNRDEGSTRRGGMTIREGSDCIDSPSETVQ
jgi:hypothetical protein